MRFKTLLGVPNAEGVEFAGVITMLLEKDQGTTRRQVLLGHTSTPWGRSG